MFFGKFYILNRNKSYAMHQWRILTKVSQVKKNDAVRTAAASNSGKRWIYIVEKIGPGEIHVSGGQGYPTLKVIYQDELDQGDYEYSPVNISL